MASPSKRACAGLLPAERVLVLLDAQLVGGDIDDFLLSYVLRDRGLVQPDGRDTVALCPELPVSELVLETCMLVEHEQRAFALRIPHKARDADLGWNAHQHVHVVGHQVPLYYLLHLLLAEVPEDLALAVLVVDGLSSILWTKHDVVPAHPFRMHQAVGLLCQGVLLFPSCPSTLPGFPLPSIHPIHPWSINAPQCFLIIGTLHISQADLFLWALGGISPVSCIECPPSATSPSEKVGGIMGSRKRSARAKEREKFLSSLGSMDDVFTEEETHQRNAGDEKEEARLMKACLSKQRYATRQEAEEIAALCAQHGTYGLEVYRCPYCKGWHLTSHPWKDKGQR